MPKSKESYYKEKVLAVLNRLEGCKFINTPTGGRFNAGRGFPDVLGSWHGLLVFIEFKHESNPVSPAQVAFLEKWKDAAICCLFRSFSNGLWTMNIRDGMRAAKESFDEFLIEQLPHNLEDIRI